jgi:hypothetical protein
VRILFLAVLAAGLSAGLARAQEIGGKFTLPFEARWGTAVLPAGNYSFRVNASENPCMVSVSQGGRVVAFIMTSSTSRGEVAGSSALIAVRGAESYRIRALRLAEAGVVLQYMPPKAERRQILAQKPELFQRLPVLLAAK